MENLELIFVYQHIRHGARGRPSSSYNSLFIDGVDEFRVSWIGEGDGELPLLGKRQHYDIGVRNRHKYGKGKHCLGLIDFSKYDPEEVLFHAIYYNRTHHSLNSELLGKYKHGILDTLTEEQKKESYPPNVDVWKNKSLEDNELYTDILNEIEELGNKTVTDSIPIFNAYPFPENRFFNLQTTCNTVGNMRKKNLEGKDDLLYGYFLNKPKELTKFF